MDAGAKAYCMDLMDWIQATPPHKDGYRPVILLKNIMADGATDG